MVQTFYHISGSPPCLAVLLTAENLGLKLNLKPVDFEKGEHLSPEFIKLNPMHQVPVLDDDGFVMAESRAIIQYLVNAYGNGEEHQNLYPKDPKKRYLVDKILFFDLANLYGSFGDLYYPMIFAKAKLDEGKLKKLNDNLGHLDTFLSAHEYAAGDHVTIADFCLMASLICMQTVHDDIQKFSNVVTYIDRCQKGIKFFDEVGQKYAKDYETFAKPAVQAALAQ